MLQLKSLREWKDYCISGKKPIDIPAHPELIYKDNWKSWGDWFGTAFIATQSRTLDIAVFSLSLMGKNWHEYITEAKRCLVTNGILIIAETTKSLKGRLSNLRDEIQKQGFDIYSDEERGDFTFIEAREL